MRMILAIWLLGATIVFAGCRSGAHPPLREEATASSTGTATEQQTAFADDIAEIIRMQLGKAITEDEAASVLGRTPDRLPVSLTHIENKWTTPKDTFYKSAYPAADEKYWVGHIMYRAGDQPAYLMLREVAMDQKTASEIIGEGDAKTVTLKTPNGPVVAELRFNHTTLDGKPLEPEWVKFLWHLAWYQNGILHELTAANIGMEELLRIAEKVTR